jgi:pimeloyl-ACP methyl ester carboxylesterase
MPHATIDGVSINYEVLGDRGPAMALSPGGRNALDNVKLFAERMAAAGYRVLLHDRRNCGASDIGFDLRRSEYEVWADDLFGLAGSLGMLPVIVGGSSSGARLALLLALRHPRAVRALILWRVTGGAFAVRRLAERYYDQYIRLAEAGGGLRRGAFRRAHPQPTFEPRAPDGDRPEGFHRHHAGVAGAVQGGRRAAADWHQRRRLALDQGAGLPHPGR